MLASKPRQPFQDTISTLGLDHLQVDELANRAGEAYNVDHAILDFGISGLSFKARSENLVGSIQVTESGEKWRTYS